MIAIIGAGIGGLACAIDLAAQGFDVTIFEKELQSGGKMREALVDGWRIDCGPTVFTMRWVFEELFARAGASFADCVSLSPLEILARHAWNETERLDLFADIRRAADAVSEFSSPAEGRRFLAFCKDARNIYRTLKKPFLSSPRPNPLSLTYRIGMHRVDALFGIRPFETMWRALSSHFQDPRLRQLFGRYATYGGSSPFLAPATLMLIAHVEQEGVLDRRRRHAAAGGRNGKARAYERCFISVRGKSRTNCCRQLAGFGTRAGQRRADGDRCGRSKRQFRCCGGRPVRRRRQTRRQIARRKGTFALGCDLGDDDAGARVSLAPSQRIFLARLPRRVR